MFWNFANWVICFSSSWLKAVAQFSSRVWNIYHGCDVAYAMSVSLNPLRRKLGFKLFMLLSDCLFTSVPKCLQLGCLFSPSRDSVESQSSRSPSWSPRTGNFCALQSLYNGLHYPWHFHPMWGVGVKWSFLTPLCFVSANSCFHSYTKLSWIQGFRNESISQYSKCLVKNHCDLNIMQNDLLCLSYTELCVLKDFYDNVSTFF